MGKLKREQYIYKPGPWLSWNGVVRLLNRKARAAGGLSKWAAAHNVSYEYARLVSTSRRIPGPAITKALGLEKALMWRLPPGRKDSPHAG